LTVRISCRESQGDPMTDHPSVPTLQSPTVTLRAPHPGDADGRFACGNNAEIVRMFGGGVQGLGPLTRQEAERWTSWFCSHPNAWVVDIGGGFLGEVRLDRVNQQDRSATLAVGLYDPHQLGRGIGTEAVRLILAHAFDTLALNRVDLKVLAYNRRAIRCYEKCGFIVEGRLRQSAWIDGECHDDLIMAVLADDYYGRR
jgi:RimJ/RimL family protein N-acetyltransferase